MLYSMVPESITFGTLFAAGFRLNDLRVKGTQLPGSGATPVT